MRLTVGGNIIIYPGDPSAPDAYQMDTQIIFNSTILSSDARFVCADIKYYFLNNLMSRYEYMRITLQYLPQDIIDQHRIMDLVGKYGFPILRSARVCTV